jgi:hypothetical protein
MMISLHARAQDISTDALIPFLASESTSFLLDNARLLDGTGAGVQEGLSLLIEDGFIAAIGPSEEPGLIMMHEHPPDSLRLMTAQAASPLAWRQTSWWYAARQTSTCMTC